MSKKSTVILLVLVLIVGLFSGCVQGADEDWKMPKESYTGLEEFVLNKDRVHNRVVIDDEGNETTESKNYYLVQENDYYELYLREDNLNIALIHKASGQAWYSNADDDTLKGEKPETKSQLQINTVDKTDSSQRTMNSFSNCVDLMEEAIEFNSEVLPYYLTYADADKQNLRIKYVIGDILPDFIIPAIMPTEVRDWMQEKAKEIYYAINVDENGKSLNLSVEEQTAKAEELYGDSVLYAANPQTAKSMFVDLNKEKYDKASQSQRESYESYVPGIAKLGDEVMAVQKLPINKITGPCFQKLFEMWFEEHKELEICEGYATVKELREAWNNKYDVVPNVGALFMIPVDYVLTDKGLQVVIQNEQIVFNESKYAITQLDVLKYFGCANTNETGFMFTPDGSGAIVNFNNGKNELPTPIKVQLYGIDRGKNYSKKPDFSEQGFLPVFGIKKENSALFTIIQKGESVGTVITDVSRDKCKLNYNYAQFRLIETDDMTIFGDNNVLKTYQEEKFSGDICMLYGILSGEEGADIGYADMAQYYREYLIKNGMMNDQVISAENINFNLELYGAVSDTSAFLGIRYDYLNALTTFKEAKQILSQLTDKGVKGINVRYRGWANNGLFNHAFNNVRPLGELGGWNDYRELEKYASDNGIMLYPDCDVTLVYKDAFLTDGFMSMTDVSRQLSRSNAMYYQYNLMHTGNYMHQAFIVRPQKVESLADSLLKSLQDNDIKAVSLGKLGSMLTGDYHVGALIDRSEVQQVYSDVFKKYSDAGVSIATEGSNVYALNGTDVIFGLPNQSSNYFMADLTVPFYQMVVHGYVQYSGEVINQSGDAVNSLLKAIETGSGLSYRWMYAPNKDTNNIYFEDVYATCYESWIDDAISFYNRYNEELGHTASLIMVGHQSLSSTLVKTIYSDGTVVYVNYDDNQAEADGIVIPARDYKVVKEG